jgi:two-component system, NarL family, invasion response regulator UvrY
VGRCNHPFRVKGEEGIEVVVVDDHAQFRAVLRDVVAATAGMTCVGEAVSGEAAVDACDALAPDLVVMDKRMPGIGGVEAARRIAARHPDVLVVLISVETPRPETLAGLDGVVFLDKRRLSPRALAELWRARRPAI